MYEYGLKGLGALGWSDISGYPTCSSVAGGGIKRCFVQNDTDRACAQGCGCHVTSESCTTTSGNAGLKWCCPRDCPTPEHGCTPPTRNLICDLQRVDINSLTDSRSRAIWLLKSRLCSQRIDPGAVNGDLNTRLSEAVSAFQSRQGIPSTGQADAVTLRLLGFSSAEATQYTNAIAQPATTVPSTPLPWALIAASGVASMFMMYAAWKFTKRPKK